MSLKRKLHFRTLCALYWLKDKLGSRHYRQLTDKDLKASRKSDTVFIFGSGYSLHDISGREWERISGHDTLAFNWFVYQDWIRVDYHVFKELSPDDLDPEVWKVALEKFALLVRNNPHYRETIFIVQGGYRGINGNRLIGMKLLPEGSPIFRFFIKSRGIYEAPSRSLSDGLVHGPASLVTAVNFAYALGWKKIVMAGVDLYDRRYFWLGKDETRAVDSIRSSTYKDKHNTADRLVPYLGKWNELMNREGIQLYVYNPRSLLAQVLPVYQLEATGNQADKKVLK